MVIRSFLRQFFTAKTPAERLATLFWVSPAEADAALDAVGGDVSRAESLLLYAVGNNLCAATAIAEMFPAPGLDGLSIWEQTVGGRQTILAWRAAEMLPRPLRLRATLASARAFSRAMMRDFEKNFATALGAIQRATGRPS